MFIYYVSIEGGDEGSKDEGTDNNSIEF